jgi:5,10-methylenetetrahydromethanopterin reductase
MAAYFRSEDSPTLIGSVQAAERAGYRRAWLNDAHILWEDVYIHMIRVLDNTERIVVGSGVSNPVTRHFTVAAAAHGTLAQIHPGRVILGFGRGDAAVHMLGLPPMKTSAFGPLVADLRSLMRGEEVMREKGGELRLRWLDQTDVPLMLAATGPRNLRIAGAVADIVQIQVGVTEEAVAWALSHIRAGAEEAGRDTDDIEVSVLCTMWVADDREEALSKCRWAAATAANHIEAVVKRPGHGMPERILRLVEERQRRRHVYDYDSHLEAESEATAFLTDEMIDDFAIAGPPEHCVAKLAGLGQVGVGEVAVGFFNGEFDQLERVGAEVISRLVVA